MELPRSPAAPRRPHAATRRAALAPRRAGACSEPRRSTRCHQRFCLPPWDTPGTPSPHGAPSPFPFLPPEQRAVLSIRREVPQQSHAVFTLRSLQAFFSSPLSKLGKKVYLHTSSRLSLIYLAINKGRIFPTVPRAGW